MNMFKSLVYISIYVPYLVVVLILSNSFSALAGGSEFGAGGDMKPAFSSAKPDGLVGTQNRIERKRYLSERAFIIPHNHVVAAYYPAWSSGAERNFSPAQVPVEQLSHIIVAFGAICGRNIVAYRQGARVTQACNNPTGMAPENGGNQLGWYYLPGFDRPLEKHEAVLIDNPDLYFNQQVLAQGKRFRGLLPAMIDWKNRNPDLKVYWAIGGWSYSGPFYEMTQDPNARKIFVDSLKTWLSQPVMHFIDGLSIDWEAPGGGAADGQLGNPAIDGRNLVLLAGELRHMLDELGRAKNHTYDLNVALAVGPQKLKNFRASAVVAELLPITTYLSLLTYDFFGNWSHEIGFNTALKSAETGIPSAGFDDFSVFNSPSTPDITSDSDEADVVNILSVSRIMDILRREHGVRDASKILLGLPFYGRTHGRTHAESADDLPGSAKIGKGNNRYTVEPGTIAYFDLFQNYIGDSGRGVGGWATYYYPEYEAGLIWNQSTGEVISYTPPRSIKAFVDYVRSNRLGGVFAWGLDEDNGLLLNAAHEAYGHMPTGSLPPAKRWVYAPPCADPQFAKHLDVRHDLVGLTFSHENRIYQINGPVLGCPDPVRPDLSSGWRELGPREQFSVPENNFGMLLTPKTP